MLTKAMESYDGASNGNRTRGGVKKANDMYVLQYSTLDNVSAMALTDRCHSIAAFRPHFPDSQGFRQASALISATHALSFYSLTLQHGVPFKPVSIRVSQDPIGLISKVLEQNPRSYTKLDDLVDIAQNLVSAGLPDKVEEHDPDIRSQVDTDELAGLRRDAERRVTLMAVEAALREDDFETSYSVIVNRLAPSDVNLTAPKDEATLSAKRAKRHSRNPSDGASRSRSGTEDDVSWRAAFLAGRFRPTTSSPPTLRRLEQRTELLSLALLLGPTSALNDILTAWRRCEEEMTALQASQAREEEDFDDRADKRQPSALPGNFTMSSDQPEMILNQKRREVGRMASGRGDDEAPMSMFDLTRSAAAALTKNAFPLRNASRTATAASDDQQGSMEDSVDSLHQRTASETGSMEGSQRVRKRDMVASAVSGGLASGLGWVLGATPSNQQQERET